MKNKERILFALKSRPLEEVLEKTLSNEYSFVGGASYKDIVIEKIKATNPDILIIRESLPGNEPLINLIFEIRGKFPNVRIIFMTGQRGPGDLMLGEMVSYGVYDLILSEKVTLSEIVNLIKNPTPWDSVKHLLPRRNYEDGNVEPGFKINTQIINAGGGINMRPAEEFQEPEQTHQLPSKNPETVQIERPQAIETPEVQAKVAFTDPSQVEEESKNRGFFGLGKKKAKKTKTEVVGKKDKPVQPMIGASFEGFEPAVEESTPQQIEVKPHVVVQPTVEAPQLESAPHKQPELKKDPNERVAKEPTVEAVMIEEPPQPHASAPVVAIQPAKVESRITQEMNAPIVDSEQKGGMKLGLPKKKAGNSSKRKEKQSLFKPSAPSSGGRTKKIINFVGSQGGVGTTQLAFNSAVKLAQMGHYVIFLELKKDFSTIDFSLQIGSYHQGVDKAIEYIANGAGENVQSNIHRMSEIRNRDGNVPELSKVYKKMPETLDFLMYSQDFQTLIEKPEVDESKIKDLITYLLLQEGYDYVVVDSGAFGRNDELLHDIISISTETYIVTAQDFAQIGLISRHLVELKKRINIEQKVYYILNKYERGILDVETCSEWLGTQMSFVFPYVGSEFNQANYLGIPIVQNTRNTSLLDIFDSLAQKLTE